MPNYFVIHKPSNLIDNVICSSIQPRNTDTRKFIAASDKALDTYYKLLSRHPSVCVDLGHLMTVSPYTSDIVIAGRSGDAKSQKIRYRTEEQPSEQVDRQQSIDAWLDEHPAAGVDELNDAFLCGLVVAQAYLNQRKNAVYNA